MALENIKKDTQSSGMLLLTGNWNTCGVCL